MLDKFENMDIEHKLAFVNSCTVDELEELANNGYEFNIKNGYIVDIDLKDDRERV